MDEVEKLKAEVTGLKNTVGNIMVDSMPIQSNYNVANLVSNNRFNTHAINVDTKLNSIDINPILSMMNKIDYGFYKDYLCSNEADIMMLKFLMVANPYTINRIIEQTPNEELGRPLKRMLMEEKLKKEGVK
jgi:hypothetical protein